MDIRIFSCLFVKFVLYMGRFLGEGTCFLFDSEPIDCYTAGFFAVQFGIIVVQVGIVVV